MSLFSLTIFHDFNAAFHLQKSKANADTIDFETGFTHPMESDGVFYPLAVLLSCLDARCSLSQVIIIWNHPMVPKTMRTKDVR